MVAVVFCLGDSDQVPPPHFWNKKNVSSGKCVSIHVNICDYALNLGARNPGVLTIDPAPGEGRFPSPKFLLRVLDSVLSCPSDKNGSLRSLLSLKDNATKLCCRMNKWALGQDQGFSLGTVKSKISVRYPDGNVKQGNEKYKPEALKGGLHKKQAFESCQPTGCADAMRLSGHEASGGEGGKTTGRKGEGDFCALYTHTMDTVI